MEKLANLKPERVFKYFEEICSIPHGSGDTDKISRYCTEFAQKHNLKYHRDEANNVIIYKDATPGYETVEPVIIQGHLDMVCQQEPGRNIDFEKEGLDIYVDGDFIKARGTTLGGDDGIAAAMALAILESDSIAHPPLEVVFTTDEEIGMLGAVKLDFSLLKGRKMINIDSEEQDVLTVSCAGGSEFKMTAPLTREKYTGKALKLTVRGLRGGHSGVEINKGRVNANILMARILDYLNKKSGFKLIDVNGGDKGNAIPLLCEANIAVGEADGITALLRDYTDVIKKEISAREPDFCFEISDMGEGEYDVISDTLKDKVIFALLCAPNGVIEMSREIEGLVETSLNLGILKTDADKITMLFALRSNKKSAMAALEAKLETFSSCIECETEASGHYPPWEFKENSALQALYIEKYTEKFGKVPAVEAIHAGLECGVFSDGLDGADCISIGPQMYDIHTTGERLSISSVKDIFEIVLEVLKDCR